MSAKDSRLIIGLMSGTSLDGLDIALCRVKGFGFSSSVDVLEFKTVEYSQELKDDVRSIFARDIVSLEKLSLLNAKIAEVHAGFILDCLSSWKLPAEEIDCIASHGQTVYHAPRRLHGLSGYPNATLQIGDGDHLAVRTGVITISDFRQKHLAAGGEGAPLALYGDCILFSSDSEDRILLNIGGISNFTYLPRDKSSQVVSTDAGPGNTLLDALARRDFGHAFDPSGSLARKGRLCPSLLSSLLSTPFFNEDLPKSTGPELFNMDYLQRALSGLDASECSKYDLLNTVTQFTASAVSQTIEGLSQTNPGSIYVSGGGAHNLFLMELLADALPKWKVKKVEELGLSADAKEAVLFALLANETICGSAISTGAGPAVMMGKISLPA